MRAFVSGPATFSNDSNMADDHHVEVRKMLTNISILNVSTSFSVSCDCYRSVVYFYYIAGALYRVIKI